MANMVTLYTRKFTLGEEYDLVVGPLFDADPETREATLLPVQKVKLVLRCCVNPGLKFRY